MISLQPHSLYRPITLPSLSSSNRLENPLWTVSPSSPLQLSAVIHLFPWVFPRFPRFAENSQGISLSLKEKDITTRWAKECSSFWTLPKKWIPKTGSKVNPFGSPTLETPAKPSWPRYSGLSKSWPAFLFFRERLFFFRRKNDDSNIFKHDIFGLCIETTISCFFRTSKVWK